MNCKLLCLLLAILPAHASAQSYQRFSIIITELFPDPSPPVGLPEYEFIELTNTSTNTINLKGWKLTDGTSTATINVSIDLKPDSFLIITTNSAVTAFALFGKTIGVTNFPSLNNDGDIISLYAPDGKTMHSVSYNSQTYNNDIKANGGWTLEIIDTHNPCAGNTNWTASTHLKGGTPGTANAVAASNLDDMPPALLATYTIDSTTIVAVFDESLDSLQAATPGHYLLDHDLGTPISATPQTPAFKEVILKMAKPLQSQQTYQLSVTGNTDCTGNAIGNSNTALAGLPQIPDTQNIVINEILFNPPAGGSDYIELYNRSKNTIDLKQLYLANRSTTGTLTNIIPLSTASYLLFPGQYILFTENISWLKQHYFIKYPSSLRQLSTLPSMPDDKGSLTLTNMQGTTIDALQYDRQWHFPLISGEEGVALERINYDQPSQNSHNWLSAASTAGFGTPGYQNSQFRADLQAQGTITRSPATFSPDNDGLDDFLTLSYSVPEQGYVANITIFDANGRITRHLARNATLGLQGTFRWDGLDNYQRKLPIGPYIIYTELFNLQGKTKKIKNTVTLVRRL